jgi:hypothetical protein
MPFVSPNILPPIQPRADRQQVNIRNPFDLQIADTQINAVHRRESPQRSSFATPRAHKRESAFRETVVNELPGFIHDHKRIANRLGHWHIVWDIRKDPGHKLVFERVIRHRERQQRFAGSLSPCDKHIPDLRERLEKPFGIDEHLHSPDQKNIETVG